MMTRIVTYAGEVVRLPGVNQTLVAVSGRAWISFGGKDLILGPGETLTLAGRRDLALVSALCRQPLVLEVFTDAANPAGAGRRLSVLVDCLPSGSFGR